MPKINKQRPLASGIATADNPSIKSANGAAGTFWKTDGTFAVSNGRQEVGGIGGKGPYAWVANAQRQAPVILHKSGTAVSAGANTTENSLASIPLPVMAAGEGVRVTAVFSNNNNANNKTFRIRLGGIAGTIVGTQVQTTATLVVIEVIVMNRAAANSQVAVAKNNLAASSATTTATASINTAVATTLEVTGQKAVAGDVATLESCVVELLR